MAVGLGSLLILVLAKAPVWAYALALLGWAGLSRVWWPRDVTESTSDASAGEPWQNWVAGWYWATDAQHRLVSLRPGLQAGGVALQDGAAVAATVGQQPLWWSCWDTQADPLPSEAAAAVEQLRYCLLRETAWSAPLSVPWPGRLAGGVATVSQVSRWHLMGAPRRDARGQFLGFEGVLAPLLNVAEVAAPAPTPEAEPMAPAMSETEQEALRYALSHDLRAPLRVVDGFARIVKEDYGSALDKLGHDHLDRILAAAARMNGMIDAVLAQAQLAGTALQRVEVDLSALAREVGGDMLAVWPQPSRPELCVADGLHAHADALLLRRVLENLIGNALKYSAKVEAPRVEVGVMPATNPPVYYVRDNGAGFDMQHADKLFGMFQRLHSAKEFPGTGMGLAGVQNIVRRHGGRVWAESRPGEGACFYFTLMDSAQAQQQAI
ncbi:MAG TPA: ATP-binding protein [Aquabacterium sp.]|nr:ATP-binding protein [Aquabacterium sp.]